MSQFRTFDFVSNSDWNFNKFRLFPLFGLLLAWTVDNRHSFTLVYRLECELATNSDFSHFSVGWCTTAWKVINRHRFALFFPLQTELATNSDFSNFPCVHSHKKSWQQMPQFCTFLWNSDFLSNSDFSANCKLKLQKILTFPTFQSVGAQLHEKFITDTVSHFSIDCKLNLHQILILATFLLLHSRKKSCYITDVDIRTFLWNCDFLSNSDFSAHWKLKLQQILTFPTFRSVSAQPHGILTTDTVSHFSIDCKLKLEQILAFPTFRSVGAQPHENLTTDTRLALFL